MEDFEKYALKNNQQNGYWLYEDENTIELSESKIEIRKEKKRKENRGDRGDRRWNLKQQK